MVRRPQYKRTSIQERWSSGGPVILSLGGFLDLFRLIMCRAGRSSFRMSEVGVSSSSGARPRVSAPVSERGTRAYTSCRPLTLRIDPGGSRVVVYATVGRHPCATRSRRGSPSSLTGGGEPLGTLYTDVRVSLGVMFLRSVTPNVHDVLRFC